MSWHRRNAVILPEAEAPWVLGRGSGHGERDDQPFWPAAREPPDPPRRKSSESGDDHSPDRQGRSTNPRTADIWGDAELGVDRGSGGCSAASAMISAIAPMPEQPPAPPPARFDDERSGAELIRTAPRRSASRHYLAVVAAEIRRLRRQVRQSTSPPPPPPQDDRVLRIREPPRSGEDH